mmetsp:Transcript_78684/g.138785  ORF Transcript_78684/g.138785 Transcript_78684/m.138785 type:complete len:336 (-) Transcript_78684:55-1062(-)
MTNATKRNGELPQDYPVYAPADVAAAIHSESAKVSSVSKPAAKKEKKKKKVQEANDAEGGSLRNDVPAKGEIPLVQEAAVKALEQDEGSLQDLVAPPLKVPLPSFPVEEGAARQYGQAWPEHLSRKDPFAMYRRGASSYHPPAVFDPFEAWRQPALVSDGYAEGAASWQEARPPFSALQGPMITGVVSDTRIDPTEGFAEPPSYRHPEKLLPGPPLRHEMQSGMPRTSPDEPDLGLQTGAVRPSAEPALETGFANSLISWFRPSSQAAVSSAQVPTGQEPPPPPTTLRPDGPPKGTLRPGGAPPAPPGTLRPGAPPQGTIRAGPPPSGTLRAVCR